MRIIHAICLIVLALAPWTARGQASADADQRLQRATQLLDRLDAGEYATAGEHFSAKMREALGPDMLEQVWTVLPQQVGARSGRGEPRHETAGPYAVVVMPLLHEVTTIDARVTFGAGGTIEGFHVVPAAPPPAPPADEDAAYIEHDFALGAGARALAALASYFRPGTVDPTLIEAITSWIAARA